MDNAEQAEQGQDISGAGSHSLHFPNIYCMDELMHLSANRGQE